MSSLFRLLRRNFTTSVQSTTEVPFNVISNELYKERDLNLVVEKFKKYSELESFRTASSFYENTVRRLASARRFKLIKGVLEDQKKYIGISNEGFAARLMNLYGKSGMFKSTQKMFDELPDRNCKRTVLSMNALLAACLHSKKFHRVDLLFKELPQKLSIEPDLVSYNIVMKAFCEMGSLDSAMTVLEEIEKKGLKPDLITFNTLLDAFYEKGCFSDGEKLWNQMDKYNVKPDIRSYNSKLGGLIKEKKVKEAADLLVKMKSEGVEPDKFSINALIKGYVDEGNPKEATEWYSKIAKADHGLDVTIFANLLPFLCEKGDLKTAYRLCKKILYSKSIVDAALLQSVVDGLVEKSMTSEAKRIVELGKISGDHHYELTLPSDQ